MLAYRSYSLLLCDLENRIIFIGDAFFHPLIIHL